MMEAEREEGKEKGERGEEGETDRLPKYARRKSRVRRSPTRTMDSCDRDFPRQGNDLTSCQMSPSRKGPARALLNLGGAATGASSIGFPANRAFRSRTCPRLPLTARRRLAITPVEIDLILKTGNVSNGNRGNLECPRWGALRREQNVRNCDRNSYYFTNVVIT